MTDEERSAADISSAMRSFQLLESLEVRRAFMVVVVAEGGVVYSFGKSKSKGKG
jgi:hypothetical protein